MTEMTDPLHIEYVKPLSLATWVPTCGKLIRVLVLATNPTKSSDYI